MQYSNPAAGTTSDEKITLPATDAAITMLPDSVCWPVSLPDTFPLAPFRPDFEVSVQEQKQTIRKIFDALHLCETHANDLNNWQQYFDSLPDSPANVTNLKPFVIANVVLNTANANNANFRSTALPIDDGIRHFNPVTFNLSHRKHALQRQRFFPQSEWMSLSRHAHRS